MKEALEKYKTDHGWEIKKFIASEVKEVILGRDEACQICFSNPEVKNCHAKIVFNEEC